MKKLLSLSVLIAILWGCCTVEDTPKTEEKDKPVNYKVTFDANGGKGKMPEQIFAADTSQPLNPNTFKRVGYVFTEWNTEADGNGVTYMSGSYYSLTSDITLYAQWEAEETKKDDTEDKPDNPEKPIQLYSVIFMSQYGNVPDDIVGLKENDKLTSSQLPELTTDGYTFAGWYNGETKIEAGYKITGNLKLTGKWDANVYTVKFNANGGSGNMAEMSFNYNEEKALTANAFTRDDYAFAGWAVSADGDVTYADMGKVKNLTSENNATVTLYAVWTEKDKVLPVIFSLPDGTSVDSGESVTLSCATDGVKICYTIDGVTTEYTSEITITEDVTVTAFATKDGMKDSNVSTASYAVKTYTVTYTTEYAVVPNKISGLKKGYTLTAEQLPELTTAGYTFAGWYNGETKIEAGYTITGDLSLTAKWTVNTNTAYTVEHYQQNIADDGYTLVNADTENKTGTTDADTVATAKDYAGFTAKTIEQEKIAADGSTVVKIYYDRNTITLTLNLDGGEGDESIFGKYEEAVTTSANPTKTGYTLAGWNPSLPAAFPAENATYTAKWNANTYTVKFNANGGSGNMGNQTFTYDTEQALPANTFTRADYAFAGWAVSADGNAAYTDMGKVKNLTSENNATVTLYAVWTEKDKVLPVVFSLPDGTVVDSGESVTLSCATDGAKINYTIDGVTAEYTNAITITKNVTITAFAAKDGMKNSDVSTASYTVKTYTVTYTTEYAVVPSDVIGLKKGDTLTAEELPELTTAGYTFAGWYNGETNIEAGYKITGDLSLTAKWTVNTNTAYIVEHYQQNIADDGYTLVNADTENKTGTTDENTTATAKDYAGFTANTVEQMKIAADGSTIIKIYYDRNTITLTLNLDGGEGDESISGKYEEAVTTPANPTKTGYIFAEWNPELPATLPAENATYTAKWNANTDTAYKVEHYQQNIADDGYTLVNADTENKTGITDENTSATAKDYAGFTVKSVEQAKIAADGSTVVQIYYDRNTITLTLNLDGGDGETEITGKYGETVTTPANPARTGYIFTEWNPELPATLPTENATYTAKWNANTDTAYKVEHYQQNIADDGYTLVNADTENKTGVTDETTIATAKDYAGFTAKTVEQMKIAADGSTVVKIYYDRNTITLTLNLDGGDGETKITGKYGAAVTAPANPTKTGYTFASWNPELPATLTGNATYTATWTANKAGISVMLPEYNDAEINLQQSTNENTVTFTAADGFDSYAWYIDGVKQSGTSTTFAIDTLTLDPANYKVMVIVADGDEYYSATADLEVKRVQ